MESLQTGCEDDPLAKSICSCQGVANKHQIYVHCERSPFTIGFLSGAVARERRAGQVQAREKPGFCGCSLAERHTHPAPGHTRTRTLADSPSPAVPVRQWAPPGGALGGAAAPGSPPSP